MKIQSFRTRKTYIKIFGWLFLFYLMFVAFLVIMLFTQTNRPDIIFEDLEYLKLTLKSVEYNDGTSKLKFEEMPGDFLLDSYIDYNRNYLTKDDYGNIYNVYYYDSGDSYTIAQMSTSDGKVVLTFETYIEGCRRNLNIGYVVVGTFTAGALGLFILFMYHVINRNKPLGNAVFMINTSKPSKAESERFARYRNVDFRQDIYQKDGIYHIRNNPLIKDEDFDFRYYTNVFLEIMKENQLELFIVDEADMSKSIGLVLYRLGDKLLAGIAFNENGEHVLKKASIITFYPEGNLNFLLKSEIVSFEGAFLEYKSRTNAKIVYK